jgi:hypothetical protein
VDGPITSPSQLDGARVASHGGPPPGAHPIDPYGPPADAKPIDPYGPPAGAKPNPYGPPPGAKPIDPYATPKPNSGLPRRFDAVFDRYRGEIPIEYLRALVDRESNFEPKQRTGRAIGLMQIIPVVLDDYNTRNGTHYKPEHLVDPAINVSIGCELLFIIIAGYSGHAHVANFQSDWSNLRFVELLTFGWNAGFSEASGVGRVARYLEQRRITDLTIDLVSKNASEAGASKHLSNAAKVRWSESVAALYFPQGVDLELHRPRHLGRDIPVCFVGQAYGARFMFLRQLRKEGVPVECFGPGWPNGPYPDQIELYCRSQINLGIGFTGLSSQATCVKGRDFEVPGTGSFYLTTYDRDLPGLFSVGQEIMCYRNVTDCAEVIRYYLERPEEAKRIATNGRERCARDHTWTSRLTAVLRFLDILTPLPNGNEKDGHGEQSTDCALSSH